MAQGLLPPRSRSTRSAGLAGEVTAFLGGAVAVRRQAFDAAGGYPGEYFYALEETDLALGMIDAGWKYSFDETKEFINKIYESEGIEYQQVFDKMHKELLGKVDHKIISGRKIFLLFLYHFGTIFSLIWNKDFFSKKGNISH